MCDDKSSITTTLAGEVDLPAGTCAGRPGVSVQCRLGELVCLFAYKGSTCKRYSWYCEYTIRNNIERCSDQIQENLRRRC